MPRVVVSVWLLLAGVSAGVVLAAGVLKLLDLWEFERSLATWSLLRSSVARAVVVPVVPAAEVLSGAVFLLAPPMRRAAGWSLAVLLGLMTVTYLVEAWTGEPPDCGCWGLLSRYVAHRSDSVTVGVRNAMLALPVLGWLIREGRRPARERGACASPAWRTARGWTLVEMLVVMAVVAVLLALALPLLTRSRSTGKDSASVSLVRQHAAVMNAYAHEYHDTLPWFTVPVPGEQSPIRREDGTIIKVTYFGAFSTWPYVLGPRYENSPASGAAFRSPWAGSTPQAFDYLYPCVFIAHADYWDPRTRTVPPEQLVPTRLDHVLYPSAKAVVTDDAMWQVPAPRASDPRRTVAGCIDGSGIVLRAEQMAEQYAVGDGVTPPFRDYTRHYASYHPLLHTVGGVRARDFFPR
jgi:prepilin-type N-terminal cleavage/methylation domain-containing protein